MILYYTWDREYRGGKGVEWWCINFGGDCMHIGEERQGNNGIDITVSSTIDDRVRLLLYVAVTVNNRNVSMNE